MSGKFPSVHRKQGPLGVATGPPNSLLHSQGAATRYQTGKQHPLEQSEKNYVQNQEEFKMQMLRNLQGLHAPLRLRTERALASKVGRLAPLESSNLMLDVITGRDETLDFHDILGGCEHPEVTQVACSDRLLVKATETV